LRFNDFTGVVAEAISDASARSAVLGQILQHVESYYFTSFPSDLYIDIFDFSEKIVNIRESITDNPDTQNDIITAAKALDKALSAVIPSSWARNGTSKKMGVHVIPLQGIAVPAASHELAYVRGSMQLDKGAFVENSKHWVPNAVPQNNSLLDKLFYWIY
jgi:hypothetical protein